jgi:hypothetical protein
VGSSGYYPSTLSGAATFGLEDRGDLRPIWELLYNHYVVLKKLQAP